MDCFNQKRFIQHKVQVMLNETQILFKRSSGYRGKIIGADRVPIHLGTLQTPDFSDPTQIYLVPVCLS